MRESHFEKLLEFMKTECVSIQHLNLNGIWLDNSSQKLSLALRQMPELNNLQIPYIADSLLLDVIHVRCAKLNTLNLSGSTNLKDEDVGKLANLSRTLQSLCLDLNLNPETISNLIHSLPKLVTLGGYQKTGEAIRLLHKNYPTQNATKLKHLSDKNTSFETLQSVIALCPGN